VRERANVTSANLRLSISSVTRLSLSLSLPVIERAWESRGLDEPRFRESIRRVRDLPLEHFLFFLSRSHSRPLPKTTTAVTTKRNTSGRLIILLSRLIYLSLIRIHAHVHTRVVAAAHDHGSTGSRLVEAFRGIVYLAPRTRYSETPGAMTITIGYRSRICENRRRSRAVPDFSSKLSKLDNELVGVAVSLSAWRRYATFL